MGREHLAVLRVEGMEEAVGIGQDAAASVATRVAAAFVAVGVVARLTAGPAFTNKIG